LESALTNVWFKQWQEIIINKYTREYLIIIYTHWPRSRRAIMCQNRKGKVWQSGKTEWSGFPNRSTWFGRTRIGLAEDDYSTLSSDDDNDDDDTNNEYDNQQLLLEFQKLISKHMKLQKRYGDLLCSHEKLIDSYALLEATHEVMVTTVKFSQPHTCICAPHSIDLSYANSCCPQAKPSCDDHVLV
jgi:hypothetical protein